MAQPSGIEVVADRSDLVRDALALARQAHSGQIRSASGGRPYIDHPVAVAEALLPLQTDDEVLAAALLHDVVEDSELTTGDIRERCGERAAELVAVLTDDPSIDPYEKRKREHRGRVEQAGADALAIYAADKLTNVRMLRSAYELEGEEIGEELEVSLDEKIYIWELDLEMLFGSAPELALVNELADELAGLWSDRATEARASS